MKVVDLVRIISRFFAIYVLMHCISLIQIYFIPGMHDQDLMQFLPTISLILYLLLTYILWFQTDWISKLIVRDQETVLESIPITAVQLQYILFTFLGLWVLADSIPVGVQVILQAIQQSQILDSLKVGTMILREQWLSQLIGYAVKIAIGFWLLFGAKGIANYLIKRDEEGQEE